MIVIYDMVLLVKKIMCFPSLYNWLSKHGWIANKEKEKILSKEDIRNMRLAYYDTNTSTVAVTDNAVKEHPIDKRIRERYAKQVNSKSRSESNLLDAATWN